MILNNSEIICYCSNVSEEEILRVIENGAKTLDDVRKTTKACTLANCKTLSPKKRCCSPDILALLAEHGN